MWSARRLMDRSGRLAINVYIAGCQSKCFDVVCRFAGCVTVDCPLCLGLALLLLIIAWYRRVVWRYNDFKWTQFRLTRLALEWAWPWRGGTGSVGRAGWVWCVNWWQVVMTSAAVSLPVICHAVPRAASLPVLYIDCKSTRRLHCSSSSNSTQLSYFVRSLWVTRWRND